PLSLPPIPTLFPYTTLFRSLQLAAQHVEVILVRRLHQAHRLFGLSHADAIALADRQAFLAIESEEDLLILRHDSNLDIQGVRQQDRKSTRLNSSHDQISYAV